MTNPETAGPSRDGSKSLAKESRWGVAVTWLVSTFGLVGLDAVNELHPSTRIGTLLLAAAAGILTAYVKKNR